MSAKDLLEFTKTASNCGLPADTVKLTPNYMCTKAGIMSVADKVVSPKVVSKLTLAEKLTADQQTSVRSGYAAAAGWVPIENVEIIQDARRAVSYTITVFVKDSAAATAVMTKLSDTAALKGALKASVPDPRTVVCVCVCVCVCVLGTRTNTPSRPRVSPPPSQTRPQLRRLCNMRCNWVTPPSHSPLMTPMFQAGSYMRCSASSLS